VAPTVSRRAGPEKVDLARFNSSAAAIFSEAVRGGQNLWPKPRPDIVRKTGTRQRRSSGPEKVELARAYAQTNSEARYITAKKKVKPRIRPDRGQTMRSSPAA
jgi:hypothetical protein